MTGIVIAAPLLDQRIRASVPTSEPVGSPFGSDKLAAAAEGDRDPRRFTLIALGVIA